jgi:putative Holliday junction resolvase
VNTRIAGIDYGTARIGIAIADPAVRIATPHASYTPCDPAKDAEFFRQLTAREGIVRFVVGLPVHLSGDESPKSKEAREFGSWLQRVTQLPVDFFDERFTSKEAGQLLSAAGLKRKRRKSRIDKVAAQIMLAAYLESQWGGEGKLGAIDE